MIVEAIMIAGLLLGISLILILWHQSEPLRWLIRSRPLTRTKDRHRQDCILCKQIRKCLHHLCKRTQWLYKHPEMSEEILTRLKELLPAEMIFKEQRQRLYGLAGHIHKHTAHSKHKILHHKINRHLRKINHLASEQERRIHNLHRMAESYTMARHHKKLHRCIKAAIKLQHNNHKLLKDIHRTEKYLTNIIRRKKAYRLNIATTG